MKRARGPILLVAAFFLVSLVACRGSNHRTDGAITDPPPINGHSNDPVPGVGQYIDVEVDGAACVEAGRENGIKIARPASPVKPVFKLKFSLNQQVLGAFDSAELRAYRYSGGQLDFANYYMVEPEGGLLVDTEYEVCSEKARVRFYTGRDPQEIAGFPAGKYRFELEASCVNADELIFLDVTVAE